MASVVEPSSPHSVVSANKRPREIPTTPIQSWWGSVYGPGVIGCGHSGFDSPWEMVDGSSSRGTEVDDASQDGDAHNASSHSREEALDSRREPAKVANQTVYHSSKCSVLFWPECSNNS
jgi:hypothetical protein